MFKSTSEFNLAMGEILKQLCNNVSLENITQPENISDRDAAIVECIDKGYITGVTYGYTQDGKPHFSVSELRVTHSGLSFMESF